MDEPADRPARKPPVPPAPHLEQQFAHEAPGIAAFLRRWLPGDAIEDAVQETLLRAWRYRARYDGRRPVGPWLLAIARRVALDRQHRQDRGLQAEPLDDPADPSLDPPELRLQRRDEVDGIRRALQHLEPVARQVFEAFYGDGRSVADIAARLELPVNTVKSHLRRARRRLSRALADPADDTPGDAS